MVAEAREDHGLSLFSLRELAPLLESSRTQVAITDKCMVGREIQKPVVEVEQMSAMCEHRARAWRYSRESIWHLCPHRPKIKSERGAVSGLEWYLDRRQEKGGQRVVVNKESDTHTTHHCRKNNYMQLFSARGINQRLQLQSWWWHGINFQLQLQPGWWRGINFQLQLQPGGGSRKRTYIHIT